MKLLHLFLGFRQNYGLARGLLLYPLAGIFIAACGTYRLSAESPDGAPVQHAIEHPAETHEDLPLEKLLSLGIEPQVIKMGDGEHGIYIARRSEIRSAIAEGQIRINFSLWDAKENFVLAVPEIADSDSPFIVAEGYQLRIALIPTSIYNDLKPGTSYITALNPPQK